MNIRRIGILGAGKVGIVFAQLALKAGYSVYIAGSGDPEKIRLSVAVLAPGATVATKEAVALESDIVMLALPLSKYRTIPRRELSGKIVIDAMNYWWEVDGARENTIVENLSSSEAVQEFLFGSRVIKAFSHMGYHELYDNSSDITAGVRKAIAVAGDIDEDVKVVESIVKNFGFDPVNIGKLANGIKLEPGHPAFGANVSSHVLAGLLASR